MRSEALLATARLELKAVTDVQEELLHGEEKIVAQLHEHVVRGPRRLAQEAEKDSERQRLEMLAPGEARAAEREGKLRAVHAIESRDLERRLDVLQEQRDAVVGAQREGVRRAWADERAHVDAELGAGEHALARRSTARREQMEARASPLEPPLARLGLFAACAL